MHPAIQLQGVTKRYGTVTAVDDLDLQVPTGQILALLGPNGAGKSTTTEMILGLTQADRGTVRIFGDDPTSAVRAGNTGAMLQNGTLLWDTSVSSLLKMMRGLHERPLPMETVIEMADIGAFLRTSTSKLSGGQAQRVRFALAILGDPKLLLLDEPTVGLDVDARRRFWQVMDEFADTGRTVVFATHYLDEADDFADRIVVMHEGRVVADGTGSDIKDLVGGKHVSFVGPERDWSDVSAVVDVQLDDGRVVLSSSDADATLRSLFSGPHADDVSDVQIISPRLEDAFLTLVK